MNNILLVDKPASWTSFDVVAKIRGAIRATYAKKGVKPTKRQLKVGHAGTLDPFATGLLVILLGDACSRSNEFLKQDKIYESTFRLGVKSSTGDPDGDMTQVSEKVPTREDVEKALTSFTGEITQTPPAYSAIKINGERAYNLARKGKEVDMPTRQVTIHSLVLLNYAYPDVCVRAHVSSGTYIRSLAEDIGTALGTGAYCAELRRTKTGTLSIDDSMSVEQVLARVQLDNDEENHDDK
jgi:tRNA pseudouridine55 synthase